MYLRWSLEGRSARRRPLTGMMRRFRRDLPVPISVSVWTSVRIPELPRVHRRQRQRGAAILAGRAGSVTLTRLDAEGKDTDSTLTVGAKGSKWNIVFNSDGSQTITTSGHLVFFIFPTDVPPGPSSTLFIGRVVFIQHGTSSEVLSHEGSTTVLRRSVRLRAGTKSSVPVNPDVPQRLPLGSDVGGGAATDP